MPVGHWLIVKCSARKRNNRLFMQEKDQQCQLKTVWVYPWRLYQSPCSYECKNDPGGTPRHQKPNRSHNDPIIVHQRQEKKKLEHFALFRTVSNNLSYCDKLTWSTVKMASYIICELIKMKWNVSVHSPGNQNCFKAERVFAVSYQVNLPSMFPIVLQWDHLDLESNSFGSFSDLE